MVASWWKALLLQALTGSLFGAAERPDVRRRIVKVSQVEQLPITYCITFVQRSGSNFFCEALSRTGVAGRPTEYFMPYFPGSKELGVELAGFEESIWARERGVSSFQRFLDVVLEESRTPNGVSGVKLPWNAVEATLQKISELPDYLGLSGAELLDGVFDRPRFIHLERRDRVRQAVSWALAGQTGHYSSSQVASQSALKEPSFDIEFLDGLYRLIGESQTGWSEFFQHHQLEPLRLYYEDIAADLEGSTREVLAWLGIPAPKSFDLSNLSFQPQSTHLNEEWAERFRSLRPETQSELSGRGHS